MSRVETIGFYDKVRIMNVEEGRDHYGLSERGSLFASDFDNQLYQNGIGIIEMPVSNSDFKQLIQSFETALEDSPEIPTTYIKVDDRHGNDVGHVRKDAKIDPTTNMQSSDAKDLFHFSETAYDYWDSKYPARTTEFDRFIKFGREIHMALVAVAKKQLGLLKETHPNISNAYYPYLYGKQTSLSFMRIVSYDSYVYDGATIDVAKPHTDIGGFTIQAYADAPGFWGSLEGNLGKRTYYQSDNGEAQGFMGDGHEKVYGVDARINKLPHGVGRIIVPGQVVVPKRHAIILFTDMPLVNYGTTVADTLPQLYGTGQKKLNVVSNF